MSDQKNTVMPQYGLDRDYPLLCQYAEKHVFAERMGGCTSQLHQEIDAALQELWMARRAILEPYRE